MSGITGLEAKFTRIGARVKLSPRRGFNRFGGVVPISLDIGRDRDGEFFQIVGAEGQAERVEVLDVQADDRHLLLMVRDRGDKHKFLCGHDERHWFVAAVPESASVGTVGSAKEALKPELVRSAQARSRVGSVAGNRRKNDAFRRQGEWFFLPEPALEVDPALVLRDEPIVRGNRGKPHRLEFCYRVGGQPVRVCLRRPNGLLEKEYRRLLDRDPSAKNWGWRIMVRNPEVYARGKVRHLDHRTIDLRGWHRVVMNTETRSKAMRHVDFLD